jgi:Na+-translocating ferredoxin:NAD+ oxidoreductase subunit G
MAKLESTLKNMALSLTLISLGASALLAVTNTLTLKPIEQQKIAKTVNAISQVVPEFDNNPAAEVFRVPTGEGDSLEIYTAKKGSVIVGYAVKSYTNKGFSGFISFMIGFRPDGSIVNINVLEQKETPGLGAKMVLQGTEGKREFKDQFIDKNPATFALKVKKDGGQVDAITAATISSRAFCDGVQRAYKTLKNGGLI